MVKKVRKISAVVRGVCQEFAKKSSNYDFCEDDLSCMCATASMVLSATLNHFGENSGVVDANYDDFGHCWVKLGDLNIDITVSQFGGPEVCVRKGTPLIGEGRASFKTLYFGDVFETRKKLLKAGWPEGQIATKKNLQSMIKRSIKGVEKQKL